MKKLSKNEWVATAVGVLFVAYAFSGVDVVKLFNNMAGKSESTASVAKVSNNSIIVNDVVKGVGETVSEGKVVSIHYILSLSDGTVIQNSKDTGTQFNFIVGKGDVISGFEQGVAGMKVGGVRSIIIPPEFAYGASQVGPIPPNSTLIFTVELMAISDISAQMSQ